MSGLNLDITYNDIVNTVVNVIKNNCKNIGSVNLPDCYKAGFSKTYNCTKTAVPGPRDTTGSAWTPAFIVSSNAYVSAVAESTVRNEFKNFLTGTCGLPNLNDVIYDNKFLNLLHDVLSFTTTKCELICVSPFDTNYFNIVHNKAKGSATVSFNLKTNEYGYLVYDQTGSTNYKNTQSLAGSNSNKKVIDVASMNTFLKVLMTTINQTVKIKRINYTITFN